MSGEKQVRLRESEYHRLMQTARQVEQDQSQARLLQQQLQQAQDNIQSLRRAADKREQAFEQTINSLSSDLQTTTREFQQRLAGQQKAFAEKVRQLDQRLAHQQQDFSRSVERLDERLEHQQQEFRQRFQQLDGQLNQQRTEYLELISQQSAYIDQQFARINQQQRTAELHAAQWIADSRLLLDYIEQNQQHQKFAPGELDALKSELTMTNGNLQQGQAQAAIATGQALYGKALKLQAEIEFRQMEWDTYYGEAIKTAREHLAELEVQQTAKWLFETEQGNQELYAEIDYWSDGALNALKARVEQSIEILEQESLPLTLEDLKQRIQLHQTSQAELDSLITLAKERLIASQLRVSIAEDLLDELDRSGWQLVESVWQGEQEDGKGWKNSYHLKLSDLGGNEMITVILPEDTPLGQIENRVQFAYYPKDNNDRRFAATQTERLNDTLHRLGLTQERLQCVPGHERTMRGDESRRDFTKVSAMRPTRKTDQ